MGSTRLPGKVALPLRGDTVLGTVIDRLKNYKKNIIIATTDNGTESRIIEICKSKEVFFYKGSEGDVLSRYYHAAIYFGLKPADQIIRVTSDCPLIDPDLLQKCISMHDTGVFDYVSNRLNRTVPVGLDVEVLSFDLLGYVYRKAKLPVEREHVTPFIYHTNIKRFNIGSCEENENNSNFRLTVDEYEDYIVVQNIYKYFSNRADFNYCELIEFLKNNKSITSLNSHIIQKVIPKK